MNSVSPSEESGRGGAPHSAVSRPPYPDSPADGENRRAGTFSDGYDLDAHLAAHYGELYRMARAGDAAVIAFFKGELVVEEWQK